MKRKLFYFLYLTLAITLMTGCGGKDDPITPTPTPTPEPTPEPTPTISYTDGYNFVVDGKKVNAPDADKAVTIVYKAPTGSSLYGQSGDMYLYSGVGPKWEGTPSSWTDNNSKYKMSAVSGQSNTWSINLTTTLRSFYGISTDKSIQLLNLIVRTSDGKKQTGDYATLVSDAKNDFTIKEVTKQSAPLSGDDMEGIHVQSSTSATLILYDQDTKGNHKDHAYVIGDFNKWQLKDAYQMNYDETNHCWWITLSGLPAGKTAFQYFMFSSTDGGSYLCDPYCEEILENGVDGNFPSEASGQYVSVLNTQPENYTWKVNNFKVQHPKDLVIYEMLLRDFTGTHNLAGAKEKLPYLKALGVNAIELMPIQEFGGSSSWGYDTSFYFALDQSYGTLKEYKEFIDACHENGFAVIMDVVYNHTNGNSPFAKMYWDVNNNRPSANNPWLNEEAPHKAFVFGIDFNHESKLTRAFVKRNIKYLIENYHIDGFRFDFTKGFTQKKTTTDGALSEYDANRVEVLKDYVATAKAAKPDAILIMEHFVTNEEPTLAEEGVLFWKNMNNAYCQTAMGYQQESGFTNLIQQPYYVGYMESHDEERMAYKQDQWGVASIKGNLNNSMKQLAANTSLFLTVPGPKMIWEFGELGYNYSINSNEKGEVSDDYRTAPNPIHWEYFDNASRKGLYDVYSKLMTIRNANPELFEGNATLDWKVTANDWNHGRYLYLKSTTGKQMVVLANFLSDKIEMTFPAAAGNWKDAITGKTVSIKSDKKVEIPAHQFYVYTQF